MTAIYRFYKEEHKWYIQLDDWDGDKEALEMVAGADVMLDILSNSTTEVKLLISTTDFSSKQLSKIDDEGNYSYHDLDDNFIFPVWLCSVAIYVFGEYPSQIFISKL